MTAPRRRKIFVKTFGCQMNVYDSERMTELLGAARLCRDDDDGGRRSRPPQHLPHPREGRREGLFRPRPHPPAEGRSGAAPARTRSSPSPAASPRPRAPRSCAARPSSIWSSARRAIIGCRDLIARARARSGARSSRPAFPRRTSSPRCPSARRPRRVTAFLTVQEGCDKFCTFCVVPYTRGAEFSRPVADVEAEARRLVDHGVREITLLGQNVNAYHGAGPDGRAVVAGAADRRLARIDGLERLRYTTSHPRDMSDDLIAAHRDEPKLMPYLHLPFQAGADRILAAMNRKHTARRLSGARRAASAPRAPTSRCRPTSSSAFPARPTPSSRPRSTWSSASASPRPTRSSTARGPARRPPTMATRCRTRSRSSGCTACRSCSTRQQTAFNSRCVGKIMPVLFERAGPPSGPARRPLALPASGSCDSRFVPARAHRGG